jgi:hypothetical protein
LLYWSRAVKRRALLAWLVFHRYRAAKAAVITAALTARRQFLVKSAITVWLQVGFYRSSQQLVAQVHVVCRRQAKHASNVNKRSCMLCPAERYYYNAACIALQCTGGE